MAAPANNTTSPLSARYGFKVDREEFEKKGSYHDLVRVFFESVKIQQSFNARKCKEADPRIELSQKTAPLINDFYKTYKSIENKDSPCVQNVLDAMAKVNCVFSAFLCKTHGSFPQALKSRNQQGEYTYEMWHEKIKTLEEDLLGQRDIAVVRDQDGVVTNLRHVGIPEVVLQGAPNPKQGAGVTVSEDMFFKNFQLKPFWYFRLLPIEIATHSLGLSEVRTLLNIGPILKPEFIPSFRNAINFVRNLLSDPKEPFLFRNILKSQRERLPEAEDPLLLVVSSLHILLARHKSHPAFLAMHEAVCRSIVQSSRLDKGYNAFFEYLNIFMARVFSSELFFFLTKEENDLTEENPLFTAFKKALELPPESHQRFGIVPPIKLFKDLQIREESLLKLRVDNLFLCISDLRSTLSNYSKPWSCVTDPSFFYLDIPAESKSRLHSLHNLGTTLYEFAEIQPESWRELLAQASRLDPEEKGVFLECVKEIDLVLEKIDMNPADYQYLSSKDILSDISAIITKRDLEDLSQEKEARGAVLLHFLGGILFTRERLDEVKRTLAPPIDEEKKMPEPIKRKSPAS